MTNRTAAEMLAVCIDANRPVLLTGHPGTAKTAMIEALAAERGAYLEVVIASQHDPTTILGIPMPSEDRKYTEPTMPGWARRINDAHAAGRPTMLFLDELSTVHESVTGPLLGVVQSRRAEGWTLPAETRIVAAQNPTDTAVGGWALAPAMANRWVHVDWPVPIAEWRQWAAAQPSPTLQLLAEYFGAMPDELLKLPTDLAKRSGPWPSPRSWSNAAALIDATGDYATAATAVGDSAATMFATWAAQRDVPSFDALMAGDAPLPTRPDAFRTAVESLTAGATEDNLDRVLEVLRAGIAIDAGMVAAAVKALAVRGLDAGIADIVDELTAAGAVGAVQS